MPLYRMCVAPRGRCNKANTAAVRCGWGADRRQRLDDLFSVLGLLCAELIAGARMLAANKAVAASMGWLRMTSSFAFPAPRN